MGNRGCAVWRLMVGNPCGLAPEAPPSLLQPASLGWMDKGKCRRVTRTHSRQHSLPQSRVATLSDFHPPVMLIQGWSRPDTAAENCEVSKIVPAYTLMGHLALLSWHLAENTRLLGQRQRISSLTEIARAKLAAFSYLGSPSPKSHKAT